MLQGPSKVLLLAGFTLAHALWNVSDTPANELLVPLAITESGGRRTLQRYEAPTQAEAISRGKAEYSRWSASADAWAFAREGAMRLPSPSSPRRDVIVVDFWTKGMKAPITVVQPFERAARGRAFHLIGEPFLMRDGRIVDSRDAAPVITGIIKAIGTHSYVAPLWKAWKSGS